MARTTSSGIDSPTIQQRRIKTAVTVGDGRPWHWAALSNDRDSVGQTQVPILGNVRCLARCSGRRTMCVERTELVIFIRPQVIRDTATQSG